jgi:autophagy-related protein 11
MATTATLASLASSWGMSFGRKKKAEGGTNLAPTVETAIDGSGGERQPGDSSSNSSSARDLLKKF